MYHSRRSESLLDTFESFEDSGDERWELADLDRGLQTSLLLHAPQTVWVILGMLSPSKVTPCRDEKA